MHPEFYIFLSLGIASLSNKSQKPGNRIMNSIHRYHLLNIHEKNTENSVLLPCQLSLKTNISAISIIAIRIKRNDWNCQINYSSLQICPSKMWRASGRKKGWKVDRTKANQETKQTTLILTWKCKNIHWSVKVQKYGKHNKTNGGSVFSVFWSSW